MTSLGDDVTSRDSEQRGKRKRQGATRATTVGGTGLLCGEYCIFFTGFK